MIEKGTTSAKTKHVWIKVLILALKYGFSVMTTVMAARTASD